MLTLERARAPKVTWLSLVGLILVPLLVAAGFLWATWNSDTRLDRVQAAIVNNDEGTTLNDQFVPLGRQLAGGLVNGEADTSNFDWVLTDTDDARDGLQSGTYAAVVTIPQDFSRRATSFATTEVADISPATIEVQTSQVSGIADGVVAQVITTAARNTLNTVLTKQYLDNIYLGFNSTKKQFQSVAKGARELADGSGDLSDALFQTSTGAAQLADGLEQLDGGTQQLSAGITKLANGTKELPGQTKQLANGAQKSADGASDLADGVKQFSGGLTQLNDGTKKQPGFGEFADGAAKFASGAGQYGTLGAGVGGGVRQLVDGMDVFASMSGAELAAAVPCPFPASDPDVTAKCEGFYAGFVGGTQAAVHGAKKETAVDGKKFSLYSLSGQLATGGSSLATNGPLVAKGLNGFAGGIDKLATNGPKLAKGTRSLAKGLDQLADGTDQLATGLTTLNKGIQQTATGTSELADGTSQSATGGRQLSDGLVKLADGGRQLADGSDELATGLEKGAKQIPTYDKQTRTALSSVVATPVTAERPASLFADVANTTFLAVLALWLGGLASFVVLRAVPARVLTSMKPSWRLAGEALLPAAGIAAVQAIALTTVLQNLLGLSAGQVLALLPFTLLAGVTFVAVNHALVAWLGGVGRFISIATVVLAAASAITQAVPPFLGQIVPFLPLTPVLEGARAIATDSGGVGGSAGLLLAWLLAGLAAGVLAVSRHRMARVPEVASVRA